MSSYPMPSGAWLSGGPGAGFKPVSPPGSGYKPVSPPGSADKPVSPPGADDKPVSPPRLASSAGFPLPWEGADPAWTYASTEALLGQALRKSRARLLRVADWQLTSAEIDDTRARGRPAGANHSHLWRWDPQFRIETLVCELASRCCVRGRALWLVDPGGGAVDEAPAPRVLPVFSIGPLDRISDDQVDKVLRAAAEREDRLPEILAQADDFWPFFESLINLRLDAAPRLAELLAVAQGWGMQLLMGLKHGVAARRPMHWSSQVMPVIPTPGHGSLPSGHATVAALNAELLRGLLYRGEDTWSAARATRLDRLARRIAFNRVVAGLHFPVDSLVGYALGTQLARVLMALAGAEGAAFPAAVDDARMAALDPQPGARRNGLLDKPDRELDELSETRLPALEAGFQPATAPGWAELWRRTVDDLQELRA